ncbi:MAG: ROK family protein [Actinobacteria bacterium]|nr:ROK family protein [Actinomycetota bacterium]
MAEELSDSIPVLEVGGTHVTAGWVNAASWQVSGLSRTELPGDGTAEELIALLAGAGARLAAPSGAVWGIAVPGPFDYARGVAYYVGVGKFEALAGVDVGAALGTALSGRLCFSNDASAYGIGEWLVGAARGSSRCAVVTLGTGVGSAFLDNGNSVESGPSVPPEAELHLLSHAGRPLEDRVSRRAIRAAYAAAGGSDAPDVKEIADRARAGDPLAAEVFAAAFRVLGAVLGPWLRRFEAELLVVGGSISRSFDLIEAPLRDGLSAFVDGTFPIRPAGQPELAPVVGAAYPASRLVSPPVEHR